MSTWKKPTLCLDCTAARADSGQNILQSQSIIITMRIHYTIIHEGILNLSILNIIIIVVEWLGERWSSHLDLSVLVLSLILSQHLEQPHLMLSLIPSLLLHFSFPQPTFFLWLLESLIWLPLILPEWSYCFLNCLFPFALFLFLLLTLPFYRSILF